MASLTVSKSIPLKGRDGPYKTWIWSVMYSTETFLMILVSLSSPFDPVCFPHFFVVWHLWNQSFSCFFSCFLLAHDFLLRSSKDWGRFSTTLVCFIFLWILSEPLQKKFLNLVNFCLFVVVFMLAYLFFVNTTYHLSFGTYSLCDALLYKT